MTSFYQPLYIRKYETGLVQDRQNFIIPEDAFPVLNNAFIFRERIQRKPGYIFLGRLRRVLTSQPLGNLSGGGTFSGNIKSILSLESNSDIEPGSLIISDGVNTFTDNELGILVGAPSGSGTINYSTMDITLSGGVGGAAITADFNYHPRLPCMGLRSEELSNINNERLIAFDTKYSYRFVNGFQELIPGTTWTGNDSDFFWSTNYWVDQNNKKVFWVTNFSGISGDPIRYTSEALSAWIDFSPTIDSVGNKLTQCAMMLPFRGRMLTFNTFEGTDLASSLAYPQRIRWAAIGNPFSDTSSIVTTVNTEAWRDDIPGQGGFLEIPTSQNIVSVGFVRDNLVIYCERSTWQLRYTGKSIAPFQIEKVNTELGAESTFSAVQFDTSLVGIGDKGVVSCDSYSASRIDIKIPDLVLRFKNLTNGQKRVHGIRDFQQRLAYWTYVSAESNSTYPNRRLVYNYENDSWAIFTDSFTCLGTFQPTQNKKWEDFSKSTPTNEWQNSNFPWKNIPAGMPAIIGGNQQGFIEYLGQTDFQASNVNDISLSIKGITGNTTTATSINCPEHNLQTGDIIEIINIPSGTDFSSLNGNVFMVTVVSSNSFNLTKYNDKTLEFSDPQLNDPGTYIGGGNILIKDNFVIQSKKFNFLDDGQNIQIGYMDILLNTTSNGAISLNIYVDYNDSLAVNTLPENIVQNTKSPDSFFNTVIPTYSENPRESQKEWQRIYCQARGGFITLEFTFSNEQMSGEEQEKDVQIDSQVLWIRKAGRQLARGA